MGFANQESLRPWIVGRKSKFEGNVWICAVEKEGGLMVRKAAKKGGLRPRHRHNFSKFER